MAASTRSPAATGLTIADSNPPVPALDTTITPGANCHFQKLLKRDVVGVDVTRVRLLHGRLFLGPAAARRPRWCALVATAAATAGGAVAAPGVQELDVVGHDLGGLALLPVLALPGTGLDAALDIDQRPLLQVLGHDLGQVPAADVPADDVVVVGVLLLLALRPRGVAVGGDREGGDGLAGGRVAHLRVAGQAADQLRAVQAAHSSSSCWAAGSAGAAGGTGSGAGSAASAPAATGGAGRLGAAPLAFSGLRTTRCLNTVSEMRSVASISGTRAGSRRKSVSTYWPSRRCPTS